MSRLLGILGLVIALAVGMYIYSRQVQSISSTTGVSNPKTAVSITGVRADLMSIAQAERGYFALEAKYASLDELISSHSVAVSRQRPPYTYEVEVSGSSFRVIATRAQDDNSGAPAQLSVDENLEFHQSE